MINKITTVESVQKPSRVEKKKESAESTKRKNYYSYQTLFNTYFSVVIPSCIRQQDETIYRRFAAGKLVFKPNRHHTEGMVEIPFSSLENLLNGTFDLSRCGILAEHFIVSTGYKTRTITTDDPRTEVWITPKFLIEQNIQGSAKYFDWLLHHFSAPIGLYWTMPSDKCEYYNISGSCYTTPHFGKNSVYNLQTPIEELPTCNLMATVFDMTMSPYDLLKPKEQRNMVRNLSTHMCLDETMKDAMLFVQF